MSNMTKIKAHFMNENGVSKAQIARELNVSASTVSRWIKDVEAAKVASKTITIIDEDEPVNEMVVGKAGVVNDNNRVYTEESFKKVVQRRKVWEYVPVKASKPKSHIQKPKQDTAMSIAFASAFAG